MTEGAPERLMGEVMKALAYQKGFYTGEGEELVLNTDEFIEKLTTTGGKIDLVIPKGDVRYAGQGTTLSVFTRQEVDLSKGIEIKSAYEPPIEGEEIKFGLVIKDENGNAMYVWSALQIDRGKLSMTIYQKPFDLGLESPYHQEDEIKEPYMTGMGVAAHVVYPIGLLAYASEYPEVKKMSVGDEIYELD